MIMTGRASALKVSDGVDALYGLPFYLSTPCAGHTLWVANGEHAEYLLGFVRARLRPTGRELGHRLPAWVLSRKHRGAVVHALNGLLREARSLESAHRPGTAPCLLSTSDTADERFSFKIRDVCITVNRIIQYAKNISVR